MIRRRYDRGSQQHPPIAVEGKKCQDHKILEMRFNASSGQMNQQTAAQHLSYRDHLSGQDRSWLS